jgi:AcrR family transcriptional regulator
MPNPTHGERKRQAILGRALDLGSVGGLEQLTIGRLADAAGMSRSGVFAHFGSKQELQLETVAAAQVDFEREVLAKARDAEPGLDRLRALTDAWLDYVSNIAFSGGCFFARTTSEFGTHEGAVHDLLSQLALSWVRDLLVEARTASRLGEISAEPEQIVFRIHAFAQEANWARELFGDAKAFERARVAVDDTLASAEAKASSKGDSS